MNRRTFIKLTGATTLLTTVPTLFAEKKEPYEIVKDFKLIESPIISPPAQWIKIVDCKPKVGQLVELKISRYEGADDDYWVQAIGIVKENKENKNNKFYIDAYVMKIDDLIYIDKTREHKQLSKDFLRTLEGNNFERNHSLRVYMNLTSEREYWRVAS